MKKTIVFFDIDGTLMGLDKHIPGDAVDAVRRLRQRGHLAVINTGRPYRHIEPGILDIGFDGFVCSCGAHIVLDGKTVSHRAPSPEVCREMIGLVRRCRLSPLYESEEGIFFDATLPLAPGAAREKRHYAARGFPVDYDIDTPGFCFDKFCAYELPGCDLEHFLAGAGRYFEIIGRENEMLEMPVLGCSKERGIAFLSAYAGVVPADCVAVGDGRNDLPMLRAAGHSVAMGDGDPILFDQVEYVTAPLESGGIARALEHYGLI